jgi:hypothetical protein
MRYRSGCVSRAALGSLQRLAGVHRSSSMVRLRFMAQVLRWRWP